MGNIVTRNGYVLVGHYAVLTNASLWLWFAKSVKQGGLEHQSVENLWERWKKFDSNNIHCLSLRN